MIDAYRALSDPTRRRILDLLRKRRYTSGEIAAEFDSTWPTISRHLGVLRKAGLILSERNGQEIMYELTTTTLQDMVNHMMRWTRPARDR